MYAASKASGNLHLGALLLESLVASPEDATIHVQKKARKSSMVEKPMKTGVWIKLAEVYRLMEIPDIFRSIYESFVDCPELIMEAIKYESMGDFGYFSSTSHF